MRRLLIAPALLVLAACDQPPVVDQPAAPAAAESVAETTQTPASAIDGWQTDTSAYALIGGTMPMLAGEGFSSERLRNRWTILGVWPADNPPAEEATFAAALSSAVDQDPDLDLLIIHPPSGAAGPDNPAWPRATVSSDTLAALNVPATPAYLLIGPDLTIEGYRGALSASPEDGIKPVIWGVSEIRKQVAAPG